MVSFASFMDETALYADLILPNHTYLERWGDVTSVPGVGWGYAAIQQPVVKPLYQTRHTGDLLIQLAHALGDATAHAFPEKDFDTASPTQSKDFESLLRRRYRGLFESERGQIVTAPSPATFEEFWAQLERFRKRFNHRDTDWGVLQITMSKRVSE